MIWDAERLWAALERTREQLADTEPLLMKCAPVKHDEMLSPAARMRYRLSAFSPHPQRPGEIGRLIVARFIVPPDGDLYDQFPCGLYLHLLWVHPDLRGRGAAEETLREWLEDCTRIDGESFDAIVVDIRLVLIELFTRYRFRPVGKPPSLDRGETRHPEAPDSDKDGSMPERVLRYHRFALSARSPGHWLVRPSNAARGRPCRFSNPQRSMAPFVTDVDRGLGPKFS